jgi:hypothetical protein
MPPFDPTLLNPDDPSDPINKHTTMYEQSMKRQRVPSNILNAVFIAIVSRVQK